jgi:tetratricopeptide (TPR) repeat protein
MGHRTDIVPIATALRRLGLVLCLLATVSGAGAAPRQDTALSATLTDEAADLIQEGRLAEALELLDQAIAADQDYWQAYYQRGRLFGMREDYLQARDALLRAGELNPGHAHTHRLAWEAAYRLGDYENAWDQAIRASLAGVDMNQWFLEMYGKAEPPEDFEQRIRAPRIFVSALDLGEVEARSQLPFNRNPTTGGIGTISGRPAYTEGVNRANENAFNLMRVRNTVRDAVARAPYLGSVLSLELADYVLGISVDALGEGIPVSMQGYLRLYDAGSGEAIYFTPLNLRDISSDALLFGEIERQIIELQQWTLERNR